MWIDNIPFLLAGVGVALKQACHPAFKKYTKDVIHNAQTMGAELVKRGYTLSTGEIWCTMQYPGVPLESLYAESCDVRGRKSWPQYGVHIFFLFKSVARQVDIPPPIHTHSKSIHYNSIYGIKETTSNSVWMIIYVTFCLNKKKNKKKRCA